MTSRLSHFSLFAVLLGAAGAGGRAEEPPAGEPPTVCIDPGHPSEVGWGARSATGLREVDVAWEVALLIKSDLEHDGIHVVLTKRSAHEYVTNRQRAEIANRAHARLMLRLHCDAGASAHGTTFYYPNRSATIGKRTGPSPAIQKQSFLAARTLERNLAPFIKGSLSDDGIKGDNATKIGRKQGALTGSVFSEVPTVLVEMVSLGAPHDVEFISKPAGVETMAKGLASGVEAFVRQEPAPTVKTSIR